MSEFIIGEIAQSHLSCSGWSLNRKIEVDKYLNDLVNDGYELFPSLNTFLENFCQISFVAKNGQAIHFDPSEGIEFLDSEWAKLYSRCLKKRFVIVGTAYDGRWPLFLTEDLVFYAGADLELFAFGENFSDSLDNLCSGKAPIRVEIKDDGK